MDYACCVDVVGIIRKYLIYSCLSVLLMALQLANTPASCSKQAARATPKGSRSLQRSTGPFADPSLCMLCAGEPEKAKQLLSVVSKPWNTVKFDTEYELVIYVFQGL